MVLGLLNANLFIQLPSYHGSGAAGCRCFVKAEPCLLKEAKGLHHNTRFRICHRSSPCKKGFFVLGFSVVFFGGVLVVLECFLRGSLFLILVVLECSFRGSLFFNPCGGSWDDHLEDMNVACVASMCVHVHVHAQSLSHPAGMAMLQVWSLVGRWHSQCGVSGPKIDSRTPTNVNHQYLTVYSRLSGMVLDICRGLVLCFRLNPEAIIANAERQLSNRRQKALLKF